MSFGERYSAHGHDRQIHHKRPERLCGSAFSRFNSSRICLIGEPRFSLLASVPSVESLAFESPSDGEVGPDRSFDISPIVCLENIDSWQCVHRLSSRSYTDGPPLFIDSTSCPPTRSSKIKFDGSVVIVGTRGNSGGRGIGERSCR